MCWSACIVPGWVGGGEGFDGFGHKYRGGWTAARPGGARPPGTVRSADGSRGGQAGEEEGRQLSAEYDHSQFDEEPPARGPGRAMVPGPSRPFPVGGNEHSPPAAAGNWDPPRPGLGVPTLVEGRTDARIPGRFNFMTVPAPALGRLAASVVALGDAWGNANVCREARFHRMSYIHQCGERT